MKSEEAVKMMENYKKLIELIKREIRNSKYICTTNYTAFIDNAKNLLEQIGEL